MDKIKRILAWAGIVLLVLMYVLSLVFSLFRSDLGQALFRASLGCTILVPVLLYLFFLVAKAVRPDKSSLIDCVVFDVGRVLADCPWEEHAESLGLTPECTAVIREKIIPSPLWRDCDIGIRPYEEVTEDFVRIAPAYESEIRRFVETLDECISPFWYTESLIRALRRRGYKVFYLSNWSRRSVRILTENGTFDFLKLTDGGLWSHEIHAAKPDREMYDALASRFHLTPSRCVFIDDSEENVRAARAAGFAAIHFTEYNDMIEKLESVGVRI